MAWPFESVVRDVVLSLARSEYEALERRTQGSRLSADELAWAVAEYGRTLIAPPSDAFALDVVRVTSAESAIWSVDVPLWTLEEGRSDLTLQLTVYADPDGSYRVQIDDLHVL